MTKTLTYSGFAVASLVVILAFLTAKTYSQLAVAAILYPALILFAFKVFPRKSMQHSQAAMHQQSKPNPVRVENSKPKTETTLVADIDRRAFLKLIGATGISFFLFSLFGRRVETLIFGRTQQPGINLTGSPDQYETTNTSLTDRYKISEIDEGPVTYYGFTDKTGGWLIMREDAEGSSFRYAKGNSDFPGSWASRQNQKYDYFYNLN